MTPCSLNSQHVATSSPSCVFAPFSPWISADSSGLHRRSCRALPGRVSSDEPLVREALSGDSIDETIQPQRRMASDVALVQTERELIDVAVKVLSARVMVDSVKPTLQDGPDALNAVGRDCPARELSRAVVHCLVVKEQAVKIAVCPELIGVDRGPGFNYAVDFVLYGVDVGRLYNLGEGTAPTLAHPQDGSLTDATASRIQFFVLVLVPLFPADESLVDLDHAAQFLELPATCLPQASQDEPRAFLGDADLFCQLHRRDALTGCNEQIHRVDPLVQRDMGALENRSRANREIELASVASVVPGLARRDPLSSLAGRAYRTVGPETALQVHARRFFVREQLEELEGADSRFAHSISGALPKQSPMLIRSDFHRWQVRRAFVGQSRPVPLTPPLPFASRHPGFQFSRDTMDCLWDVSIFVEQFASSNIATMRALVLSRVRVNAIDNSASVLMLANSELKTRRSIGLKLVLVIPLLFARAGYDWPVVFRDRHRLAPSQRDCQFWIVLLCHFSFSFLPDIAVERRVSRHRPGQSAPWSRNSSVRLRTCYRLRDAQASNRSSDNSREKVRHIRGTSKNGAEKTWQPGPRSLRLVPVAGQLRPCHPGPSTPFGLDSIALPAPSVDLLRGRCCRLLWLPSRASFRWLLPAPVKYITIVADSLTQCKRKMHPDQRFLNKRRRESCI